MTKIPTSSQQDLLRITQKVRISTSEIVLLQADVNYTVFSLISGEKIIASSTLKHFEKTFPQNQFLRINKSQILNKAFVKNISHNRVTLKNEQVMTVSRRRIQYVHDNI
jgi:two-component system, LytTR family, response regulator